VQVIQALQTDYPRFNKQHLNPKFIMYYEFQVTGGKYPEKYDNSKIIMMGIGLMLLSTQCIHERRQNRCGNISLITVLSDPSEKTY
jgi:hypothetical protein